MRRVIRLAALCVGCLAVSVISATAQDISGTWDFVVELDAGSGEPTFVFEQEGNTLSGVYEGLFGDAEVTGTVNGNQVEFSFEVQGATAIYTGTIDGDTMEGTCDYGGVGSGEWEAQRAE